MRDKIIAVDLDGTLIYSDLTWESLLFALFENPLKLMWLIIKTMGSLNKLKEGLSQHFSCRVSPEKLPYNKEVLDFLMSKKKAGASLILATASHISQAEKIASYLGFFDAIMASDHNVNLKSHEKAKALVKAFGAKKFIYLGNSKDDLPVWDAAGKAICVNCSQALFKRVSNTDKVLFSKRKSLVKEMFHLLRVYQWVKNTLLFLPLIAAHKIFNIALFAKTGVGFLSFSCVASSLYIINDLIDLNHDRSHPRKCHRPLARGSVPIPIAFLLFGGLMGAGVILALLTENRAFFNILILYGLSSFLYSIVLKRIALLDVLVLAFLFVVRIFAGQILSNIDLTHWFLLFSGFIFFSLALAKRSAEFRNTEKTELSGRGYIQSDYPLILSLGVGATLMSLVVFGLYLNSPDVMALYKSPSYLWGVMPLMTYALTYVWLMTGRGKLHDDPILFLFKSRRMYFLGALIFICTILAKF